MTDQIEGMVEDIITNHADLGVNVAAVAALIGRKLTGEERQRAIGYMANRPYDEATWDVEMSILIASRNLSRD